MPDKPELEFVNDWSELESALGHLKNHAEKYWLVHSMGCDTEIEDLEAIETVIEYVPRLLTQYAKLVELSFALTEGWEQYAQLNTPTGLYLPDHR